MLSQLYISYINSPRVASAAMSVINLRTEKHVDVVAFDHELTTLPFDSKCDINRICEHVNRMSFGATDCSLPMLHALKKKKSYDVFMVYTDNETFFGKVHPSDALKQYRKQINKDAQLIVCGMTANKFSIADPNDRGMLDIVGFDSAAPEVIRNFVLGRI